MDRRAVGVTLLLVSAGGVVGYLIGRSQCPICTVGGGGGGGEEDTRPGLQKIAASFRTICAEISPLAEEIENALADDRRIDTTEAVNIWRRAQRLI